MTTPSNGEQDRDRPGPPGTPPYPGPTSAGLPADNPSQANPAEAPFDPYRFGAPEHPVPPEYAPPGYVPPVAYQPPAPQPPVQPPGLPPYGAPTGGYPQYPGPPYGYQPPPYAAQYPPPRTGNGKAIAALVLGLVSVLFCWTSILDVVPVVLAVVFGVLALNEARRGGGGRGMAIAGLVLAVVGAIVAVTLTVVLIQRIRPCLDYSRGSAEYRNCVQHRI